MNKINFQNLPDTSTPINATNLNQVQTNVENAIDGVSTNLTSLVTNLENRIYDDQRFSLEKSISSESWQKARSSDYQKTLPAGTYIIILGVAITGSTTGIATIRPYINNSEEATSIRQSIPVSTLFTTAQITTVRKLTQETTLSINAQVYPSVSSTVQNLNIKIIQI